MQEPNDIDAYSRDRYKARRESYMTTRPASKYDDVVSDDSSNIRADARQRHESASRRYDEPYDTKSYEQQENAIDHYDRSRYSSYDASSASYSISNGNVAALQHRGSKKPVIITILVIFALLVLAWALFFPKTFEVTVNGQKTTVWFWNTLQTLVDDGYASPQPGDLIAVDGSVAEFGGGDTLHAVINGEETSDPNTFLSKDAVITISDGNDVEEEYTETYEAIPFEQNTDPVTLSSYYDGAVHVVSGGVEGKMAVRTGNVSGRTMSYVVEQPVNAGFSAYSPAVGEDKVIALTFDDGPWPNSTKEILSILKQNGAHATFFVIGEQCQDNAEVLKQIVADGNQIATHSYDHASGKGNGVDLTLMPADEQIKEIEDGFSAIESVTGTQVSRVMRAPGGNYYGDLVDTLKPYVTAEIGWDVDTLDWTRPGVDTIVDKLLTVEPGQIVLMHDGGGDRSQTVAALRKALPILKSRGYSFVTIDELLAYGMPQFE